MVIPLYSIIFYSINLHLWFVLQRFKLVNPLPSTLNIDIKDLFFFSPVIIFLKNVSFLCIKRLVASSIRSSLFFSQGIHTCSLHTFPIFFKWSQIMNWDVLRSSTNSQEHFCRLHSTNSLKAS